MFKVLFFVCLSERKDVLGIFFFLEVRLKVILYSTFVHRISGNL